MAVEPANNAEGGSDKVSLTMLVESANDAALELAAINAASNSATTTVSAKQNNSIAGLTL